MASSGTEVGFQFDLVKSLLNSETTTIPKLINSTHLISDSPSELSFSFNIHLAMPNRSAFASTPSVILSSLSSPHSTSPHHPPAPASPFSRRTFTRLLSLAPLTLLPTPTLAREGVNRPELLPNNQVSVIDLEHYLATGELNRLRTRVDDLQSRTGYKVRILTQRFPQTPGLAVRDYWGVDDNTVVMVADYFGSGQLLKFNVGTNVDKLLPPRFWSNLSAQYGNKFYTEKNGEAAAIQNAVECIRMCLLQNGCAVPPNLNPVF